VTGQASAQPALIPLLKGRSHLLLDFDGPVCSVYSGTPATEIADQLRTRLFHRGYSYSLPDDDQDDPLQVILAMARFGPEAATIAERQLTKLETRAVATAQPTPGASTMISTARLTGRTVTIVSNNSTEAITAYLNRHHLAGQITAVLGRDPDPDLMKPDPFLVRAALATLDADEDDCVFIGDSPTDVAAGQMAGVPVIGHANRPGKADILVQAGAAAVTDQLDDISDALRITGTAALPRRTAEFSRI
jgi:HAD superfamily hydrolase (TIGR01509 family)